MKKNYQNKLVVDCANGVGSFAMKQIQSSKSFDDFIKLEIINDMESPEKLNVDCGSESLHQDQKLPVNFNHKG